MSGWLAFGANRDVVLIDDATGHIRYAPDYLDAPTAGDWMEQLHGTLPWRAQRRMMYERDVAVPRLTVHLQRDDPSLPPFLDELGQRLDRDCGVHFDSLGFNLYRDGNDSVAPHNDRLADLTEGAPIALISLGVTRTMSITTKARPVRTMRLPLEAGSLLVMDWRSQHHYDHSIPKDRHVSGPRISIAFRCRAGDRG
ncbi:alpha-ketoglutarate-dependent dioxygenase AlkB [Dyella sp.]|uniref:alpha-ketoglutarate-dependent dioxygenase AlkB n=1 Tax=Dyella sp. TaxID=1869338 RepID=UPI003F7F4904